MQVSRPICAQQPASACIALAWGFADSDGDQALSVAELAAIRTELEGWALRHREQLTQPELASLALGLLLVNSLGLERLHAPLRQRRRRPAQPRRAPGRPAAGSAAAAGDPARSGGGRPPRDRRAGSASRRRCSTGWRLSPPRAPRPPHGRASFAIDKSLAVACLVAAKRPRTPWPRRYKVEQGVIPMLDRFVVGSLGLALAAALTTQVQAKTLVFCSEGSPEGFTPRSTPPAPPSMPARADLQPAGRVRARHDQARAGAGRELGDLGRRPGVHLPSPPGGQVPDHRELHPDARLQRRRRGLQLRASARSRIIPITRSRAAPTNISTAWTCRTFCRRSRRSTTMTVSFVLKQPEAPFLANLGDGLRLDLLGRVRAGDAGRRHARAASTSIRSAPARSSWSPIRRTR